MKVRSRGRPGDGRWLSGRGAITKAPAPPTAVRGNRRKSLSNARTSGSKRRRTGRGSRFDQARRAAGGRAVKTRVQAKLGRRNAAETLVSFASGRAKRWLSRALLCGLLSRTAQALRPLERLISRAGACQHRHQCRRNGGEDAQAGQRQGDHGYLSGYAGDADHRYVFYDFRPSRSRDGPRKLLADYQGYLQTDGYIVYTSLVREAAGRLVDVALLGSWSRSFEEAISATSHPGPRAMIWTPAALHIEDRCVGDVAGGSSGIASARRCRSWRK